MTVRSVEVRGGSYDHKSQLAAVVIDFSIGICGEICLTKNRFRQFTDSTIQVSVNMKLIFIQYVSVAFSIALLSALPGTAAANSQHAAADESARRTNQGVKFARDKQYEKAIAEFTEAIEQEPNDPKNYDNRALVYRMTGKSEQALRDFTKVIELRPKDAKAYSSKGEIEVERGKLDPAINDLTRAVELDPSDANSLRYRGYAFLKKQDWEKAVEDYSKVIERSPDDVAAHEQRGYAYRSVGKYAEAIADFTKVIQARPKDAEAYRQRGLTYRLMQEYAKAADDFRLLLRLKPNDTDAQSRLNYVEAKLYSVHPAPFTPIPHRVAEEAGRKARAAIDKGKQAQPQRSPKPTRSPTE